MKPLLAIFTGSISKNGLLLAGFACLCTLVIGSVNLMTKDAIETQRQQALQRSLSAVLPHQYYDNSLSSDCTFTTNQDVFGTDAAMRIYRGTLQHIPSALVVETIAPDGYSGNIALLVGITVDGKVTGVRALEHRETPGLGDKIDIKKSDWILGFNDKPYVAENAKQWAVKKDGGEFDQFTGATITPRAVVKAVSKVAHYISENQRALFAANNACEAAL